MAGLPWVDLALAAVLLVSVIVGIVRGFVFEVLSLLGWVAAYFAAQWLAPMAASHIPIGKPGGSVNYAAAFAAAFVAALIVWAICARLLRFVIHATPLSGPDRLVGAVFGALRGLVILLAATTFICLTPMMRSPAWQASGGAKWLQGALVQIKPWLPPQISKHLPGSALAR